MRKLPWALKALAILVVPAVALMIWYVYWPEIPKVPRPARSAFPEEFIKRGEQLAAVGDCIVCHTPENGQPFAGSRALPTPFGTLFSDNITPDEETGIGNWSEEAFARAMKRGIARDGSHLYPALPYEHFTHVTDEDVKAIYAFLMTRQPVAKVAPPNKLLPGLNFRPLLAGWQLLFLHDTPFEPDSSRTEQWNRGKYLVEGLGHCGGCHTPRNIAGGEEGWRNLDGGVAEGWNAPPLNSENPSASTWTEEALFTYLKTGSSAGHSVAAGPMGPVAEGLSRVNDPDVRAIANYVSTLMQANAADKTGPVTAIDKSDIAAELHPEGSRLFEGSCDGCHGTRAPMTLHDRAELWSVTDLKMADPNNAIMAVLEGIPSPLADAPFMPAFAPNLGDKEIADLLAYARARFTNEPEWKDLKDQVASARKELPKP